MSSVKDSSGGPWTAAMILSYMFTMGGIMSSPSFTMWAFSNKDPKPFAHQQTWGSPVAAGLIMVTLLSIQGMAGHGLGGNTDFTRDVFDPKYEQQLGQYRDLFLTREDVILQRGLIATKNPGLSDREIFQKIDAGLAALQRGESPEDVAGWVDLKRDGGADAGLVPQLMGLLNEVAPWFVALLAVCALAAMQSTGAAYMSTTSGIYTRDVLRRYINPNISHNAQKQIGRVIVTILVLAALVVATFTTDALVLLGATAVAVGLQMWPALIAICYWPWLTRQGVVAGLIVGIIGVLITDNMGLALLSTLGIDVPWGRWPLTIHAGGWGLAFNMLTAIAVSAVTQNAADLKHRMVFHDFIRQYASLPEDKRRLIPLAWLVVGLYYIFGIGPGVVIGDWIFGHPNQPETWWFFGLPSIFLYQMIWWAWGVFMMWFLCFKMEMATPPARTFEVLYDEDAGVQRGAAASTATTQVQPAR